MPGLKVVVATMVLIFKLCECNNIVIKIKNNMEALFVRRNGPIFPGCFYLLCIQKNLFE